MEFTPSYFFPCHPSEYEGARLEGIERMLRILGSPKKFCSGWTRREMLQAGALGFYGLGLGDFFRFATVEPGHPPLNLPEEEFLKLVKKYGMEVPPKK